MESRLYFRQWLSGRDFALGDPLATNMVNFTYAIGDRATGRCALVDPAYGVDELVDMVEADGLQVTDVLATHYHADHIGGSIMGYHIEGIARLLERTPARIHIQGEEAPWVTKAAGVGLDDLITHRSGDVVSVGGVDITLIHTPGHTPGSQCFLVEGCLVSGDTLFLDGCGRTDLPGSDPAAMYDSLQLLGKLPEDTVLYPGHQYSPSSSAALQQVKYSNMVFRPTTQQMWMEWFGGAG